MITMKLRTIVFSGASLWILIQLQSPTIVNSMPTSLEMKGTEEHKKSFTIDVKTFNQGITKLFDEASYKYSPTLQKGATLKSQFKELVGINPTFEESKFMYPDRAALLESDRIRDLYNLLMNSQSSSYDLRVNDIRDTYLYNSSI